MNVQFFSNRTLSDQWIKYKLRQNTESSLEQSRWNPAFLKKVNISIATKLCANLLNKRIFNYFYCTTKCND